MDGLYYSSKFDDFYMVHYYLHGLSILLLLLNLFEPVFNLVKFVVELYHTRAHFYNEVYRVWQSQTIKFEVGIVVYNVYQV